MTDKAKASEHDLREGSKPEVNELLKLEKAATPGPWEAIHDDDGDFAIFRKEWTTLIAVTDADREWDEANAHLIVAMRNQLAAILEENQRLAKELSDVAEAARLMPSEEEPEENAPWMVPADQEPFGPFSLPEAITEMMKLFDGDFSKLEKQVRELEFDKAQIKDMLIHALRCFTNRRVCRCILCEDAEDFLGIPHPRMTEQIEQERRTGIYIDDPAENG